METRKSERRPTKAADSISHAPGRLLRAFCDTSVLFVGGKWMLLLQPMESRQSAAFLPKEVKGLARLGVAM